jgi:hypothetical protein
MVDSVTEILQKIERGELSAREGLRLLDEVENLPPEQTAAETIDPAKVDVVFDRPPGRGFDVHQQRDASPSREVHEEKDRLSEEALERELGAWKRWWTIPFWVGVAITLVSAGLMYWGYSTARFSWGFWMSWLPFLLGTVLLTVAWRSQTARWLHVRVRQKPGAKPALIAISIPLPLRFVAWLLRVFGRYIPDLRDKDIGLILETLDESLSSQTPLYVHVNEDEEDVQVYIG